MQCYQVKYQNSGYPCMNKIMMAIVIAIAGVGITALANQYIHSAYAQVFDNGASVFAPGQIIGPEAPGQTDEAAPGQIIGPEAPGGTDDISTGIKALDLGIIGPQKTLP